MVIGTEVAFIDFGGGTSSLLRSGMIEIGAIA